MNDWQTATLVRSEFASTNVKSLFFSVPHWTRPKAGQHYDVRIAGETRSEYERVFSVANAPEDENMIELGVELLEGGVVSPHLWRMQSGDTIEVNGPKGGHFVWDATMPGPLLMIAGGSGVVPMMSMIRHHFRNHRPRTIILMTSARSLAHVPYRAELESYAAQDPNFKLVLTLTRETPPEWQGYTKRIDADILKASLKDIRTRDPKFFIAGSTAFTDHIAKSLMAIGFPKHALRTEQFGGNTSD